MDGKVTERETQTSDPKDYGDSTPVFIVSTGRSGSQMIARVLAMHPSVCCMHEPHPHLRAEAFTKWASPERRGIIERKIRGKRDDLIRQIRMNHYVYVESSHYISHLIEEFASIYDVKFVHLCRDGRNFVRSGLDRGWYRPQPLFRRLQTWVRRKYLIDIGDSKVDHRLVPPDGLTTRFEKISWLWAEMHRVVLRSLEQVPAEKKLFLRLEDFNRDHLLRLHEFIGVEIDEKMIDRMLAVAGSRPGRRRKETVPPTSEWTAEEVRRFDEIAGDVMKRLGYR